MCEAKRLRRATSKAARDDVWTRAQPTIILPDHHRSSISCKRNSTNFGIFPAQRFPVWNWNWTWQEAIVQQGLKPPKALEDLSEAWFTKIFPKYSIRLLMYLIELAGLLRMASTSFHASSGLQDILQAIDCNGSGSLDYTEFLAAMLDQKVYMQRDCCGRHQHCNKLAKRLQ